MTIPRKFLIALCTTLAAVALLVTTATAQTPAGAAVTTEQMSGEVVQVDGNNLIVRMSNGELRTFSNVPDSRRATIDGKEVGVRDLKPGTRLTATITRTATPVTTRTVTVGTGSVVYVVGNTVVLRLPSGEIKQYTVRPDYNFVVNGRPATVNDLRQGMTVSAEKIVEETTVAIASNTTVVGQGPTGAPAASVARGGQAGASGAAPAAARGQAGASTTAGGASGQAGAASAGAQSGSAAPATLPKTGSQLPLVGLLGLLLVGSSYAVRRFRRA